MTATTRDLATLATMPDYIRVEDAVEKVQVADFLNLSLSEFGTILSQLGFDKNCPFPWTISTDAVARYKLLHMSDPIGYCRRKHSKGAPVKRPKKQNFYSRKAHR